MEKGIDYEAPEITVQPFGARVRQSDDGFLSVRLYLLFITGYTKWFDFARSLFEYWYDEGAAVDKSNPAPYHELHLLFTRWRIPINPRKLTRLKAQAGKK